MNSVEQMRLPDRDAPRVVAGSRRSDPVAGERDGDAE